MSFTLTVDQMRNGSKDVTRRLGWAGLKPGDLVMACVKCMGLGKGGVIERIHPIRIISVRWEPLYYLWHPPYGRSEAQREGFPDLTGEEFVEMFCGHMAATAATRVNRIEFSHQL